MDDRQVQLLSKIKGQLGVGEKQRRVIWLPAILAAMLSISFTLYLRPSPSVSGPVFQVFKVSQPARLTGQRIKSRYTERVLS